MANVSGHIKRQMQVNFRPSPGRGWGGGRKNVKKSKQLVGSLIKGIAPEKIVILHTFMSHISLTHTQNISVNTSPLVM